MTRVALDEPEVVVAGGQVALELGDVGVLTDKPLPDRLSLHVRSQRLVRRAPRLLDVPDALVCIG